mgnify:CR=1 FL=1
MRTKTFTFLMAFLISTTALLSQEKEVNKDGNYKGVIRIKVENSIVKQFDELHTKKNHTTNKILQSEKGYVKTNLQGLDAKNAKFSAKEYKRVFREAGKFEERHREFDLHKWYEISFDSKATVKELINSYKEIENLEYVEPVSKKSLVEHDPHPKAENNEKTLNELPDDPYFSEQWHYHNTGQSGGTADADIDLPEAWELETGNTNVVVAIEDQGVDYNHEDLAGNMWVNTGETPNNGVDDDNNGYVDDYHGYNFGDNQGPINPGDHGTHVGGTVAAETNNGKGLAGIAGGSGNDDGARLMSVQVFGDNGQGGFAEGFVYAADMGAHISQNSWGGGGESQSINDAIDYFISNGGGSGTPMDGGIVVVAAGNDNVSSGASIWPAAYSNALAVASTDHNDVKSSFSNYGSWVDIAAPGSDIASCQPGDGYQYMSGTSMACPHVSGVAALIVSKFAGNITPSGVWSKLVDNTDNIDNKNPNYTGQLGSGRLNAHASLSGGTPPPPPDEYCSSSGSDASYEWISQVDIGNFSNSSGSDGGYGDYTNQTITLTSGASADVTLTPGFNSSTYQEYWKIWIDFNNDKDFEDAGELVYSGNGSSVVSGTLNVPSSATGTTRMRVTMKYNGEPSPCESFDYGEVEDYTVTFEEGGGYDTEAPTAPTNLASGNITETSVDLSWNASSDNVGVDHYTVFQNGNSIGTTSNTSATVSGLTKATTYTFYVKAEDAAGNVSAASNSIDVTTEGGSVSYCDSYGENTNYEWIDLVELGSINNSTGSDGGYGDYTNLSTDLSPGSNVTIYVSAGFNSSSYTEYWHVWIDFNRNGEFESNEEVVSGSSSSADRLQASFDIPTNAILGETRMRVTMKYNSAASPCESFNYGEVEDYTVNITENASSFAIRNITSDIKLNEVNTETGISVYPNPAKDILTLDIKEGKRNTTVSIYNTEGSLVKTVPMNSSKRPINISELPSGTYILKVADEREPFVKQFIKK